MLSLHKFHENDNGASGGVVPILVNENIPQSRLTLKTKLQALAVKSPFLVMGDFNGHHTLWGYEEVNNRVKKLDDVILNNNLIHFNDKSRTYFHSATGTFISTDLTTNISRLLVECWS